MAWIIDEDMSNGGVYVSIHPNSGVITYNDGTYSSQSNSGICGPDLSNCTTDISGVTNTASLQRESAFDDFTQVRKTITYSFDFESCNQDGFVTWFNGYSGDNVSRNNLAYRKILDNNNGFDIKNVDDCHQIIIGAPVMTGLMQKFETGSYLDSGNPSIAVNPFNQGHEGCSKYNAGDTVVGHKIKYRTLSDTIKTGTIVNNNDLVELYFPHLFKTDYPEGDNKKHGVNIKYIESGAFSGNSRLSAITFSGVEEIGSCAFSGCVGLKNIDWGHCNCMSDDDEDYDDDCGDNCTYRERIIGSSAFCECHSLEELIFTGTKHIEEIGDHAFYNCKSLRRLILPDVVAYSKINDYVFACDSSKATSGVDGGWVITPSNITSLGKYSFKGFNMNKLSIQAYIRTIPEGCFADNPILNTIENEGEIDRLDSLYIEKGAFSGCTSLTTLILPSIMEIGDGAFSGCTNLTKLIFSSYSPPTVGIDAVPSNVTICVPNSTYVSRYQAAFTGNTVTVCSD